MEDWKTYTLGELYRFSSGLSKGSKFFGYGYDFISFKDVFYNHILPEKLSELVDSTKKERENHSVKRGDVLLTRTSETANELGYSSVAIKDYPNATFNGFTKRMRPKFPDLVVPEYSAYYFRSPKFRSIISQYAIMTTRASLNNEILNRLTIDLPSFENQKIIANILKSFDEKINLNNKNNLTLLELAKSIYKQWFIKFEFPNNDGRPYKSSGGEFENNLPIDWTIDKIGSLAMIQGGYAFKSKDLSEHGKNGVIKIKNISEKTVDIVNTQFISEDIAAKINDKFLIHSRDLLIAMTGAEVGKVGLVPLNNEKLWLNQRVGKFIERIPYANNYIFLLVNYQGYENIIRNAASGSAQPNISSSGIENIECINPTEEIISSFAQVVNPIFQKIISNLSENRKLSETRDKLLPKLLTGQIKINA